MKSGFTVCLFILVCFAFSPSAWAGSGIYLGSYGKTAFTNDQSSALINTGSNIARLPFATGVLEPVIPPDMIDGDKELYDYDVPRTGDQIVYTVGNHNQLQDLYSISLNGGTPVKLDSMFFNYNPAKSPILPDGSGVVYYRDGDLMLQPTAGGDPVIMVDGIARDTNITFSADGGTMYYDSHTGSWPNYIYTIRGIELPDGEPEYLGTSSAAVTAGFFSPDGSLYITGEQPRVYSLDGSLTNGYRFEGSIDAYDLGPESLAPDQSRFVFTTRLVDGYPYTYELYSAPIDGSEAEVRLHPEVASGIHIELAGITSDSQSAVICGDIYGNGTEDIYRTPLAGGDPVLLSPSLEPDTTTTVYGMGYGDMAVYSATLADTTRLALYSVPASGGPSTELTAGMELTSWRNAVVTPDKHFVFFEADDSQGIRNMYAVSVLGGEPVAVMEAYDSNYSAAFYSNLQFSSDGQRVIYELDDSTVSSVYYNKTYVAGIPLAYVDQGASVEGGITGGAGFIGGIDYVFDAVLTEGVFKAEYFRTPTDELDTGLLGSANFVLPGDTLQYWDHRDARRVRWSGRLDIHLR